MTMGLLIETTLKGTLLLLLVVAGAAALRRATGRR
jgi:hypothetical protein